MYIIQKINLCIVLFFCFSALHAESEFVPAEDENVRVFETLDALVSSEINILIKQDILARYGLTIEDSYAHINLSYPIVIDLEAAYTAFGLDENGIEQSNNAKIKGICLFESGEWKTKSITKLITFDELQRLQQSVGSNYFAEIDGNVHFEGYIKLIVNYKQQEKCGVAYEYEYVNHEIDTDLIVSSEEKGLSVKAGVAATYNDRILEKEFTFYSNNFDFQFGPIWLTLDTRIKTVLAVDISALLAGELETKIGIEKGRIKYSRRCNRDDCVDLFDNALEFDMHEYDTSSISYGVRGSLAVRPSLELRVTVDAEIFRVINPVDLTVALGMAVPITIDAYVGETCSDGNQDGINEYVEGALLDFSANIYAYANLKLHTTRIIPVLSVTEVEVSLLGYELVSFSDEDFDIDLTFDFDLYKKNLYFHDLLGSSSILTPVIDSPEILAFDGGDILLRARSCYPYSDNIIYELMWDDGTKQEVTGSANGVLVSRNWQQLGNTVISARMLKDTVGRELNGEWTTKEVNISTDGQTAFYPWLIPVLTNILL